MLLSIISIIANVVFILVLNMNLYTDRAPMPNGEVREWHRSPIDRLNISDRSALVYVQLLFVILSVVTSVLVLFGVKNSTVKTIQLVCMLASAIIFVFIMIATSNSHVDYA